MRAMWGEDKYSNVMHQSYRMGWQDPLPKHTRADLGRGVGGPDQRRQENVSPDTETEDEEEIEEDAEDKDGNEDENEDDKSEEDKAEEEEEEKEEEKKQRKVYTCRICNMPMRDTGHTHFRGIRYCPNAPDQIPLDEWLIHRHIEQNIF